MPSPAARPVNSASVTRLRRQKSPRALAAFQKAAPGVRDALDLASDDLESALLDGRVHVSVMVKPGSRPQPGVLFENRELRIARGGSSPTSLRPHEESAAPSPVRRAPCSLYPGGVRNTTRCSKRSSQLSKCGQGAVECDGATSLLAAVESGRGVAIVPRGLPQPGRLTCETRDRTDTAPMIVGCAYTTSSASTVPAQRFLTIVRSVATDRSPGLPRLRFKRFVRFEMSSRRPTATSNHARVATTKFRGTHAKAI